MGSICCPEKLNSAQLNSTTGGLSDSANHSRSPIEPLEFPPVAPFHSDSTTRNAPGADEAEDTKRLSVLLGPDLTMFNGYNQPSSDSDEESTSDLDIERGDFPEATSRVPKAPRASIQTRPSRSAVLKRASIQAHQEGALGWLDVEDFEDVFGSE